MESRLKFHLKNAVLLLAIVSLSVAITINFRPLYAFFVNRYHLYQEVGLTRKQLLSEYGMLLNYLNFPWIKHLQLSIPMSQSGMKHFADCKILFVFDYAVCLLTVPFATFYVRKLVKKRQTWRLINPIRWCFVVMFALGIFLVTDFEDFFVKFHEMLFRNSDWMFDPETDPIILALPAEFFMACFILFKYCSSFSKEFFSDAENGKSDIEKKPLPFWQGLFFISDVCCLTALGIFLIESDCFSEQK